MSSPGRWLELRAKLDGAQRAAGREPEEGELADALVALGGRAVEERAGWLVTHFPEPGDPEEFLAAAAARLERMVGARIAIAHAWREPEDWAEAWKRGLAPRRITPRLWVTPSWEEAELRARVEPGARVVVVDPGMAFGTAEHGTTRGALRLLDRALAPGARVLDVGAGSAILAVAAALLGAGRVTAIEGDPVAGEYARANIARNGVAERVDWIEAWADADLLGSLGPADGILANIESGVLRRLLPGFRAALRPGGWLILSGVLGEEWEAFADDVRHSGFAPVAGDADGDWRSGWFTRSEG
jgi:ribosomal protein L11 methyltransferase